MFHLLSPIFYMLYVKSICLIKPCPSNLIMLKFRKYHNITLSVLSFIMLTGITIANYQEEKYDSVYNILCKSYNNNIYADYSTKLFLYSKYLEWLDTLFIHLSNKQITKLQYTHHMSTAFLVYLTTNKIVIPSCFVQMSLNCLVHIFMYWYFAYPYGVLFNYRKNITQIQIIQHIISFSSIVYQLNVDKCRHIMYGTEVGFLLYLMYLSQFSYFYISRYYVKKIKN